MSRYSTLWRWGLVAGICFLGLLACLNLKVSDDAVDLLPGEAVRGDIRQLQRMGLVNRLFITLSLTGEASPLDEAGKKNLQTSAAQLGAKLSESGHFSYVLARLPAGYEMALFAQLQSSLALLLDQGDMTRLAAMTSEEGVRTALDGAFALLNSPTGIALKKQVQADPLGVVPLVLQKLNHLRSEFSMRIDEGFFMSRDGRSCLLVAESRESLTGSGTAITLQKFLQDIYPEVLVEGVEARVIGSLPHTLANSQSIKGDLRILLPAATILLFLLLCATLRDIRAVVVLGVPFLAAPPAIGITRMVYGDLSGLALGFGIVLLGIAVDFSIHLYLALTEGGKSRQEALREVGKPMLFAAFTTMAVFVVLLFSEVVSHRQMALLALIGVGLALGFSWLLIPTIARTPGATGVQKQGLWLSLRFSSRTGAGILVLWLVFLISGIVVWPQLRYNGDLQAMNVRDPQVMADERHFAKTWGERSEQAFIVAEGATLAEVLDLNSRVYVFLQSQGMKSFQSFAPLLPGPGAQVENRDRWRDFWASLRPEFDQRFLAEAVARSFTDQAFIPFFSLLDQEPLPLAPENFLGGPFQPLFASMLKTPESPGHKGDNKFLAMTTVAIDGTSLPLLLQFAQDQPQVRVLATAKWRTEVERLLRHDIVTLSLAAGVVIILLVSFQFRNLRAVVAVLAPVLSALAAMSLYCYLTDGQLTMMHLIMGIMVIGLSVDYGIFIVCARLSTLGKTSARAVSICAASSLIGFGVLAFAGHPALHALGITVLIGIGVAWPVALVVSPNLLTIGRRGGRA